MAVGRVRLHVWNLHNGALQDCPANSGVRVSGPGKYRPGSNYTLGREAIHCGEAEKLSIESQDEGKLCLTEPPSALGDRIEHAFQRELRAVDDLKQLARGTLSLMRFPQLSLKLCDPAVKVLLCPGSRYLRRHGIHPIVWRSLEPRWDKTGRHHPTTNADPTKPNFYRLADSQYVEN